MTNAKHKYNSTVCNVESVYLELGLGFKVGLDLAKSCMATPACPRKAVCSEFDYLRFVTTRGKLKKIASNAGFPIFWAKGMPRQYQGLISSINLQI